MNVILGIVVGSFGIKGDIKVKSCTDFASKRYKKGNCSRNKIIRAIWRIKQNATNSI